MKPTLKNSLKSLRSLLRLWKAKSANADGVSLPEPHPLAFGEYVEYSPALLTEFVGRVAEKGAAKVSRRALDFLEEACERLGDSVVRGTRSAGYEPLDGSIKAFIKTPGFSPLDCRGTLGIKLLAEATDAPIRYLTRVANATERAMNERHRAVDLYNTLRGALTPRELRWVERRIAKKSGLDKDGTPI